MKSMEGFREEPEVSSRPCAHPRAPSSLLRRLLPFPSKH